MNFKTRIRMSHSKSTISLLACAILAQIQVMVAQEPKFLNGSSLSCKNPSDSGLIVTFEGFWDLNSRSLLVLKQIGYHSLKNDTTKIINNQQIHESDLNKTSSHEVNKVTLVKPPTRPASQLINYIRMAATSGFGKQPQNYEAEAISRKLNRLIALINDSLRHKQYSWMSSSRSKGERRKRTLDEAEQIRTSDMGIYRGDVSWMDDETVTSDVHFLASDYSNIRELLETNRSLGEPHKQSSTRNLRSVMDETEDSEDCRKLDDEQRLKCSRYEESIASSLSGPYLSDTSSMEKICSNMSQYVELCLPRQFELWVRELDARKKAKLQFRFIQKAQLKNCPIESTISEDILDRVRWMWTNLCLDDEFFHNYKSNLKCLGRWSIERMQSVCSPEYEALNPPRQTRISTLVRQDDQRSSFFVGLSGENSEAVKISDQELTSKTKTICCSMDAFFRCIYKEAAKDCGQAGSLFLVDFYARNGPDDMKAICNLEMRRVAHRKKPPTPRIHMMGLAYLKQSPFLEDNYCEMVLTNIVAASHHRNSTSNAIRNTNINPYTHSFELVRGTDGSNISNGSDSCLSFMAMIPWTFAFILSIILLDKMAIIPRDDII